MNYLYCLVFGILTIVSLGLVIATGFTIYMFFESLIKHEGKEFTILTVILSVVLIAITAYSIVMLIKLCEMI